MISHESNPRPVLPETIWPMKETEMVWAGSCSMFNMAMSLQAFSGHRVRQFPGLQTKLSRDTSQDKKLNQWDDQSLCYISDLKEAESMFRRLGCGFTINRPQHCACASKDSFKYKTRLRLPTIRFL